MAIEQSTHLRMFHGWMPCDGLGSRSGAIPFGIDEPLAKGQKSGEQPVWVTLHLAVDSTASFCHGDVRRATWVLICCHFWDFIKFRQASEKHRWTTVCKDGHLGGVIRYSHCCLGLYNWTTIGGRVQQTAGVLGHLVLGEVGKLFSQTAQHNGGLSSRVKTPSMRSVRTLFKFHLLTIHAKVCCSPPI